jgi:hypothetical protein
MLIYLMVPIFPWSHALFYLFFFLSSFCLA